MIAKLVAWDETRERAIRKMLRMLGDAVVFGVRVNIPYLKAIVSHPEFAAGTMTTRFIEQRFPEGLEAPRPAPWQEAFARAALADLAGNGGGQGNHGGANRAGANGSGANGARGGQENQGAGAIGPGLAAPWRAPWRLA
jgi:acetyl/propionyl-CoA carboxylase alpha subunit